MTAIEIIQGIRQQCQTQEELVDCLEKRLIVAVNNAHYLLNEFHKAERFTDCGHSSCITVIRSTLEDTQRIAYPEPLKAKSVVEELAKEKAKSDAKGRS